MNRSIKFLLPSGLSTAAGIGLGQMTNVLQPYWPQAPHWVFALLFWSGAALTFALPVWLISVLWKNREALSRKWKMLFGFALVITGCVLGVVGLSIIAAGDSPSARKEVLTPSNVTPQFTSAQKDTRSESSYANPAIIDVDDATEAHLKNISTSGTGTFLKARGNAKISIENGSATFPDAKFPLAPLTMEERLLTNDEILKLLRALCDELAADQTNLETLRANENDRKAFEDVRREWEAKFKSVYLPRARSLESLITARAGTIPPITEDTTDVMHGFFLAHSRRLGRSSLGHGKAIGIEPVTNVINYLQYLAEKLPT